MDSSTICMNCCRTAGRFRVSSACWRHRLQVAGSSGISQSCILLQPCMYPRKTGSEQDASKGKAGLSEAMAWWPLPTPPDLFGFRSPGLLAGRLFQSEAQSFRHRPRSVSREASSTTTTTITTTTTLTCECTYMSPRHVHRSLPAVASSDLHVCRNSLECQYFGSSTLLLGSAKCARQT